MQKTSILEVLKAIPKVGRWSVVSPRPAPAQDQGELRPSGPKLSTNETRSAARIPTPPMSRYQTTSIESTYRKERGLTTRTRENPCCTYRSQRCSDRSQWSVGGRWSAPPPTARPGPRRISTFGSKISDQSNSQRSANPRSAGVTLSNYIDRDHSTRRAGSRNANWRKSFFALAPPSAKAKSIRRY